MTESITHPPASSLSPLSSLSPSEAETDRLPSPVRPSVPIVLTNGPADASGTFKHLAPLNNDSKLDADTNANVDSGVDEDDNENDNDATTASISAATINAKPENTIAATTKEEDLDTVAQEKEQMRGAALQALTHLEHDFAKLRDLIHNHKLSLSSLHLEMCRDGTHPGLAVAFEQLEGRRKYLVQKAELRRKYERKSISNVVKAMRVQLHQEYLKEAADEREHMLESVTKDWYRVNKERREMDCLVEKPSLSVSQDVIPELLGATARGASSWTQQVATLEKVKKEVGFPGAPGVIEGRPDEVESDMRELRRNG